MHYPLYCVAALTVKLLLLLLFLITSIAIYRLYFHPLSSVPGPRVAAVSNIWHAYHARNGRMLILGKTLHKKYGPVVRVGPNEVWMNSRAAFSKIYSMFRTTVAFLAAANKRRCDQWIRQIRFLRSTGIKSTNLDSHIGHHIPGYA